MSFKDLKSKDELAAIVQRHFPLFLIIFFTVVFAYPYQEGISPFDPGEYCKCAVQLLQGELDINNFYCNRIGSYLPIAFAIKLFGFGYYLTWVTVAELILLMVIVYFALQQYNRGIALLASALIGLVPLTLELAGTLYGDIMTMVTANCCILWIWHVRFVAVAPKQIIAGIVLTISWYVALLTKESALFYLLPILLFFIDDRRNKRWNRFWNAAIISGVLIGVLLLTVYVLKTSDPFHRLHLLESGPNSNTENYAAADWRVLITRLTILPVKFLIDNFSYYVLLLPGLILFFNRQQNVKEKFFMTYMISLLLLWWFGTQSFSSWTPLLLLDRLWLPLLVPMAICAAHVLIDIVVGSEKRFATRQTAILLSLAVIATVITAYLDFADSAKADFWNTTGFIIARLSVSTILFVAIFQKDAAIQLINTLVKKYSILIFTLVPFVCFNFYTLFWKDPRDNNYLSDMEMINIIRHTNQQATVIAENAVYRNHAIYHEFDPAVEQQLNFVDWGTIDSSQLQLLADQQPLYLLVTHDRLLWLTNKELESNEFYPESDDSIPGFVQHPEPDWILVKSSIRSSLYRYKSQ